MPETPKDPAPHASKAAKPAAGPACPTRLMPLRASPRGVDDVNFLTAEDDEVKVRLRIEPDGSLTILTLAPNTRYAEQLLDNVPAGEVRTELCG